MTTEPPFPRQRTTEPPFPRQKAIEPRPKVFQGPEPFQGFNTLKEKFRRQTTELSVRSTQFARQTQGLVAVPEPSPTGTGLSALETARVTQAAAQRVFTEGFNLFGLKIKLPGVAAGLIPFGISVPVFTPTIKTPEFINQIVAQTQYMKSEGMDIASSEHKLNWRAHMLEVIPWAVQGDNLHNPLRTTAEIITRFVDTLSESAREYISTDDIAFAADILDRSLRAMNIKEVKPLSAEASREVIAQVTRQRSVSIYGLLAFQSDDAFETILDISRPRLEEGTTPEDLRDIVESAGFESPEVALILEEMKSPISVITSSMIESSSRYGVLLSTMASMELDDLKAELEKRAIQGLVSRPLVALMLPVDWWRRSVAQPLAGGFNILGARYRANFLDKLPEDIIGLRDLGGAAGAILPPLRAQAEPSNIDYMFQTAREGMGDWQALGYAFENSNIPAFTKFIHEVMFDPITYFGFGAYAKIARTLPKGIGVPLAGVEEGWIALVDTAFLRIKSGLGSVALKTTNQIVRQETRSMFGVMKAFVEADTMVSTPIRKAFKSIPLENIQTSLRRAVNVARTHPLDGSEITTVGRMLRTQPPVTEKELVDLGKLVDSQLDLAEGAQLLDINRQLGYTINNGGRVSSVDETTEAIMRILGIIDSPVDWRVGVSVEVSNAFKLVQGFVRDRIAKSDEIAEQLISNPTTVKGLHDGIFSHIDALVKAENVTGLRRKGYQIGAMGAGLAHLDVVSKLAFMNSLDRFNRGFARLYLMFAFYTPFNVLEGALKTAYAGLNPLYRGDRVRILNNKTIGLVGKPTIFENASGITLDLGPTGEALRTSRAKLSGMSDKGYRRVTGQNSRAWQRYYAKLEDYFIGIGARMGLQQQASFLDQSMTKWLAQNHPETMDAVSTIIDQEADVILRAAGMDNNMIRQISAEAESRILTNAESILDLGKEFTLDKIQAAHVQKLAQKYPEIGSVPMGHILNMNNNNELFGQLTKVFKDDLPELIYQDVLHSPELARNQLKTFVDELMTSPPVTLDDLRMRIQTLQYIGSEVSGVIGAQTIATHEYISSLDHVLSVVQKGRIYDEMWDEILIPFIKESEEQIQLYITQLQGTLDSPAMNLTVEQHAMFTQLLERNTRRAALIRESWEKYQALTKSIIVERDAILAELSAAGEKTGFDAPRIRSWWDKFNRERASYWVVAREAIYRADADVLQLGARLDAVAAPEIVDTSGRALTVSDISRLFNSVPADLTRALYVPELGVLTDKVQWVERIFAKAEDAAIEVGRLADDMGFGREAIGLVYDDIIKEMTGSSAVVSIVEPRLQQVRGLHKDLVDYAISKNALLTKEKTEAINRFSSRVLDSVRDNPAASRVMLEPEPLVEVVPEAVPVAKPVPEAASGDMGLSISYRSPIGETGEFAKSRPIMGETGGPTSIFHGTRFTFPEGQIQGPVWLSSSRLGAGKFTTIAVSRDAPPGAVLGKGRVIEYHLRPGTKIHVISSWDGTDVPKLFRRMDAAGADVIAIRKVSDVPATDAQYYLVKDSSVLEAGGFKAPTPTAKPVPEAVPGVLVSIVDIKMAQTGQPFTGKLFRGSGRKTVEEIYDPHFLQGPIFGEATYTSPSRRFAGDFGPQIDEIEISLRNPLVISSDTEWLALTREARLFSDVPTSPEEVTRLRQVIRAKGHDGVIVRVPESEEVGKRLQKAFSEDTVVSFEPSAVVQAADVPTIPQVAEEAIGEVVEAIPSRPGFSWLRERQKALDAANESFTLNFPDYTNETAVNAIGRGIFPFWTYETHRLFWLPRTWLRTPGTLATQGKFQDYTDQGYIHIPGTSWEINPLRGTIWMGGMRRLLMRDFPEFYDRYPGLSNSFDWMSRFGFYPNATISGGFAVFGALTGKQQLGEVIPPIPQLLLEAFIAANPDSTYARQLLDIWVPSRWRDYLVGQAIGDLGGPGGEMLDKRYAGTPFNEEDRQWWARGQRKVAKFNFFALSTGLLRMRPEERIEFNRLAKEVIEECTGVPVQVQERAAEVGMRLSEWIAPRPECRDLVQELEGFTHWKGLTSHLRESEAGQNLALQRLFWTEIETEANATQEERADVDQLWLNGQISQSRYERDRSELRARIPQIVKTKREDARFQLDMDNELVPMPITLEERQDFADKMGFDPVFMSEEDELAAMYYQIELKDKPDEDTGQLVKDWELFYAQRRQIEEAVTQERAQLFYDRLHKRDTKLDRFRRLDYDTYIIPYQNSYKLVLGTRTEEEQATIKEEAVTDDEDRRQVLLARVNSKGQSIVADFKAELNLFKINWRKIDPEMDARIMLWLGRAAQSDEGLVIWRELRKRYGFVERDFDAG